MAQLPTRVCVFNTVSAAVPPALPTQTGSNLIDVVTAVDGVLVPAPGPTGAGVPIVLNPSGLIDPSLTNTGSRAIADTSGLSTGQLVTLYIATAGPYIGSVVAQPATAAHPPLSPVPPFPTTNGANYPTPAMGFVASSYVQGASATIYYAGTFNYNDPIHEFSASSIGLQVYLANSNDGIHGFGAITLTAPTPPNEVQAVGLVTDYNSGIVTVSFIPSFPAGVTNVVTFANVLTGTNTGAVMTVGSGAQINYSGSGVVNANQLTGDPVNTSGRTTGQALVWNGSAWAPSSAGTTSFTDLLSGTNTVAAMVVGSGASINYSGSGVVNASSIAGVTVTGTPSPGQSIVATSGTAASWQSVSATPGGLNTEVQYNNSGAFGGSSQFIWDTTLATSAFAPALAIGNNISGGPPFPNSRINVIEQFTTTTPTLYSGYQMLLVVNGTGDFTGTDYVGYEATFGTEGSANYGSAAMWQGSYTHESTGTIQNMTGMSATLSSNPGTGAINGTMAGMVGNVAPGGNCALAQGGSFTVQVQSATTAIAAGIEVTLTNSGTVTSGYGVKVDSVENSATMTNYYGLWTGPFSGTVPTNYFSLYLSDGTAFIGGPLHVSSTLLDGTDSPGTSGQVLTSTVTGVAWQTPTTAAGGSPTEIQYNLGSALAGISGSSVTAGGNVTLSVTNGQPALEVFGSQSGALILDVYSTLPAINNGVFLVDTNGEIYMGTGSAGTLTNHPTVTVYGDQNANKMIQFKSGGLSGTVSNYIDNYGSLFVGPTASATQAALTVNDDGGSTNDIAVFYDPSNAYSVVSIAQPNNVGSTAAITVNGDSNGFDLADFFVNAATGFSAGTGVTIDGTGDVTLINTTPASGVGVGNEFPSPKLNFSGTVWTGVASATDGWSIFDDTTNGPKLTFSYTGSQTNYGILVPAGTATQPSIFLGNLSQGISGNWAGGNGVNVFGGILAVDSVGNTEQVYLSAGVPCTLGTATSGGSPGQALQITLNGYAPTGPTFGISMGGFDPTNTSGNTDAISIGTPVTNPILWSPASGSGTFNVLHVQAAVNQTGTASGSYSGVVVNIAETALLGTNNLLLSLNAGTLGTTNKFYVDNLGDTVMVGYVMSSGVVTAITTKTGTYTATDTDHTINGNGTFTINLPTTNIQIGQEYYIKNIGTGVITVASSVNIDFATSLNLSTQGQSVTVQWDGTQYWIY